MLNDVFPSIGKTTFQLMQNGNDAASGNGDFTPHTFSQEKVFCYANCASTFCEGNIGLNSLNSP